MQNVYVLNAIMALALIGANTAVAEVVEATNSVNAIFVPQVIYNPDAADDEESEIYVMGGNNVAETDNVKFSSEGGLNTRSKLECYNGTQFTVSAESFHNIFKVLIQCEQSGVFFAPSAISAKDAAGNPIAAAQYESKTIGNLMRFDFSELLSEVTFTSSGDYSVIKVTAVLDIDPQFDAEDGVAIYADEAVPFATKTNLFPYIYSVSLAGSKIADGYSPVPADGIKLTGNTDGAYNVTVDIDTSADEDNLAEAPKTLLVNYKAVKPNDSTVGVTEIEADGDAVFFDLTGRRIVKPHGGQVHIRKSGSKAELLR